MTLDDILTERGSRYGKFTDNSVVAQSIKEIFRLTNNWESLSKDKRECLDMLASKISRILTGDAEYVDNWLDMQGYIKLVTDTLI